MAKKVQRQWPAIAAELYQHLKECSMSDMELSVAAAVNYFAIRRLRESGVKNQTKNATKLCSFFKISLVDEAEVQNGQLEALIDEIGSVWDGSEAHAKLLTRLLRATKGLKIMDGGRKEDASPSS
jgi:hypothetical protein